MTETYESNAYGTFASVYDTFMDNVPYEEWSVYVTELLRFAGIEEGLILELGCGTGSMTECLAKAGYDMIGIDNAEDMLEIAMKKKAESGSDILYLAQDMREFELYGTVRAVVSICDSMNYILSEEELLRVFSLVNNYLDPGGIFIFDMNTLYKYQEILGDTVIAENREEGSFIWENQFEEEDSINQYDLTLFIPEADGKFRKYEETHLQRGYEIHKVTALLEQAGLQPLAVYEAFTKDAPDEEAERVYFIAREQRK